MPSWNLISKTLPSESTTNLPITVPSISGVSIDIVSWITPFSFILGYSWRIFCLRLLYEFSLASNCSVFLTFDSSWFVGISDDCPLELSTKASFSPPWGILTGLFSDSIVCGGEIPAAVVPPISILSADGLLSGSPGISVLCWTFGNLLTIRDSVCGIPWLSEGVEGVYVLLGDKLPMSLCELLGVNLSIDLLGR